MKRFKSHIYEANLQGSTTKFSGALGAFKQYVELNPKNVEFKVDKTTFLARMDGTLTDIEVKKGTTFNIMDSCLLYTSPSPRDVEESRMPSSA